MALNFTYTAADGKLTFTPTGVNAATSLTWNFGDGNTATSTGTNTVEHTYSTAGARTVTVTSDKNLPGHNQGDTWWSGFGDNFLYMYHQKKDATTWNTRVNNHSWNGGDSRLDINNPSWELEPGDTVLVNVYEVQGGTGMVFYYTNPDGLMLYPSTESHWQKNDTQTTNGSSASDAPGSGWGAVPADYVIQNSGYANSATSQPWGDPEAVHFIGANSGKWRWYRLIVPAYSDWWSSSESASQSITVYVPTATVTSSNNTSVTVTYTGFPPGTTTIDWGDDTGTAGEGLETFQITGDSSITHDYITSSLNHFTSETTGDDWGPFEATLEITPSTGAKVYTDRVLGIPINISPIAASTAQASVWKQGSTELSNNRGIVVIQGETVAFKRSAVTGYDTGPISTGGEGNLISSDNLTGTMTTVAGYNGDITGFYLAEGSSGTAYTYNNIEEGINSSGTVSVSKAISVMQTKDSNIETGATTKFSDLRDWYRSHAIDNDDSLPNSGDTMSLSNLHGQNTIMVHIYFKNETHTTYYNNADASIAVYVDGAYDPYTIELTGVTDSHSGLVITNQPSVFFPGLNGGGKNTSNYEYDLKITAGGSTSPNVQTVRVQTNHGANAAGVYLNGTSSPITRAVWSTSTADYMSSNWSKPVRVLFPLNTDVPGSTITTGNRNSAPDVSSRIPPGDREEATD